MNKKPKRFFRPDVTLYPLEFITLERIFQSVFTLSWAVKSITRPGEKKIKKNSFSIPRDHTTHYTSVGTAHGGI